MFVVGLIRVFGIGGLSQAFVGSGDRDMPATFGIVSETQDFTANRVAVL